MQDQISLNLRLKKISLFFSNACFLALYDKCHIICHNKVVYLCITLNHKIMKLVSTWMAVLGICFSTVLHAQTQGTMTFNFTQGAPLDPFVDDGCVLAVWIQNGT